MAAALRPERPFIGRLEVLDALRRRSDGALGGQGGLTFIEGESGVGKSTLIDALLPELRGRGFRVLTGRSSNLDNPPPLNQIRSALEEAPPTAPEAEAGSALAFVAPVASEAVILGFAPRADTVGPAERWPVQDRLLEAMTGSGESAEASRSRLFASLSDRFLAIARRGPTLLYLEDVHVTDDASLEFLEYLGLLLEGSSLWVVASTLTITGLPETRRVALERIVNDSHAEVLEVRPFTAGEVIEFVRSFDSTRAVAVEEITRWHSQTGGNPQFLEQLLRTHGELGGIGAGFDPNAPLPDAAQLLARQLPHLSEEETRVMMFGAILGREFPFALLLKATGEEEEPLAEIVERLVGLGILRERPEERLEFVREDLRGEIYATLTDTRRRLLHKRAGEALEATGAADIQTVFALARHFYLGKIDEKAAAYNRLAGEFAARTYSPATARPHLERALECHRRAFPNDLSGELEITLELAVQLDRVGELKPAETLLSEALARPPLMHAASPTQRSLLKAYLARIMTDQGRWDDADRLTEELLGSAETHMSPVTLIAVHRLRGELLYYWGRYAKSLEHHDQALALATSLGDEREIALENVRRANVLGMIPERLNEAVEAYVKGKDALLKLGDKGEAAYALLFQGVVLSQHGKSEEGLKVLHQAEKLAEEAHDLRRIGWALFNIADLTRELVERHEGAYTLESAETANRRSKEVLSRIGDRFGLVQTHIIEGKILILRERWRDAELELLEAFRLVRELNTPADELDVVLRLAEVALGRGDLASARSRAEELRVRQIERIRPDLSVDYQNLLRKLPKEGDAVPGAT